MCRSARPRPPGASPEFRASAPDSPTRTPVTRRRGRVGQRSPRCAGHPMGRSRRGPVARHRHPSTPVTSHVPGERVGPAGHHLPHALCQRLGDWRWISRGAPVRSLADGAPGYQRRDLRGSAEVIRQLDREELLSVSPWRCGAGGGRRRMAPALPPRTIAACS